MSTFNSVPPGAGISDVARLAGVSQGTVSNVLNHPERVATATRDRVRQAISALAYVPNGAARSLAAGGSRSIGLILSDLENSLFVDIARGAERAAAEAGMSLLLANSDGRLESEDRYLDLFAESRVLSTLLTLNDDQHFRQIVGRVADSRSLVLLNFQVDPAEYCSVDGHNERGGYLATRHLIDIGRRRLVFVGGPDSLRPVSERHRGFSAALAESGLTAAADVTPDWINRSDGWRVGTGLVEAIAAGRIDGIVAASDLLAAGMLQAFATLGRVRVPHDVAIVGYDNNQAAWDSPVPISTIGQPGEEMGYRGARLAMEELVEGDAHQHRAVVLEPTLIVRESTVS
ncbi:LacI family DNA-binding transcriptional regulator [Herbiconiux sp.]|uniref:LacI family DNA-binding transcriptional regulator n=1 Tax=Herbiconiux sp. TaxID=1871186 RepID=UPI0025C23FEF|nr:LacI family DNA-binding transcriptional regulator [Herbiconiux sp.]